MAKALSENLLMARLTLSVFGMLAQRTLRMRTIDSRDLFRHLRICLSYVCGNSWSWLWYPPLVVTTSYGSLQLLMLYRTWRKRWMPLHLVWSSFLKRLVSLELVHDSREDCTCSSGCPKHSNDNSYVYKQLHKFEFVLVILYIARCR
jgi:hypothetical protein